MLKIWLLLFSVQFVLVATEHGSVKISSESPFIANPFLNTYIEEITFTDLDGNNLSLHQQCANFKAIVIAVHDVDCPVAMRLAPELQRIEQLYTQRGVQFLHVNMHVDEEVKRVRASFNKRGLKGLQIHDKKQLFRKALAVQSTTEVFVIGAARTLRYAGAINDQYGIGFSRDSIQQHYLRHALDAVLNKRLPDMQQTRAPGCLLPNVDAQKSEQVHQHITYHKHISRILQKHCVQCHRKGSVGPFSFEHYAGVKRKAKTMLFAIDEGIMPPWFASDQHGGPWKNNSSLSTLDKKRFGDWVNAGMPEGDKAHAPSAIAWPRDWQIGNPDYVISFPRSVAIPAEGTIPYIYAHSKTDLAEDKWVTAIEIRSKAPEQMHHVLLFQEAPRKQTETREQYRRRSEGGTQTYFAGAVPGKTVVRYPPGKAKRLRAGSWIKFQLHYTANGTAAEDQIEVAFTFAKEKPQHEIYTRSAFNKRIEIPPHAQRHMHRGIYAFRQDFMLTRFSPHAHLRSESFRYELLHADGRREIILDIPNYDFNWQIDYVLQKPLLVRKGSSIVCTCWYNNSASNPANPDPNVTVRFGEQTWDEMLIGYFEGYTTDGSLLKDHVSRRQGLFE